MLREQMISRLMAVVHPVERERISRSEAGEEDTEEDTEEGLCHAPRSSISRAMAPGEL